MEQLSTVRRAANFCSLVDGVITSALSLALALIFILADY